ncbi:MAG: serine/threonine-protein kinase [Sandaracinus sp.]
MSGLASLSPIGRIGRYEVLGRLAQGGMAEIFLARAAGAAGVARIVVVKRILPSAEKSADVTGAFIGEARVLARLSHPALVSIEEFGEQDRKHFLVMEWVRGVSLRRVINALGGATGRSLDATVKSRPSARLAAGAPGGGEAFEKDPLREKGGMPWPIAARIFADLAAGLHHAHVAQDERGRPLKIVHRDVTPENVIVTWDGGPKLLDFGIAKSTIDPQKTAAGVLKGKLQYIAPEQYQGKALDARSDVFALGACMYEALAGESLYARASEYETVAAIVLDPSVPSVRAVRPDVPEELDAIVARALVKDRDGRTASADEISAALEKLLVEKGQGVRDADVGAWLTKLFPGESGRDPKLDRTPLAGVAAPRKRTQSSEMEQMLLGAEADIDADAFAASGRSRGRSFVGAMLIALLVVATLFGLAVYRAIHAPQGVPSTTAVPEAPASSAVEPEASSVSPPPSTGP